MEQSLSRRVFVAINIPRQIQEIVQEFQNKLGQDHLSINWVRPENFHITLAFLGDLSAREVSKLSDIADDISENVSPFSITFGKIGVMEGWHCSQTLYLEPKYNRNLLSLQGHLQRELISEKMIKTTRRRFKPHLTIGKFGQRIDLDRKIWRRWQKVPISFSWQVESFAVMKSNINVRPVRYTKVHQISLI